ncbi:phosphate ABC transporter ATP-binding protein PstB [Vibrio fluvialis]|uniref:phosphate ABC transporter ATP-binding protein PstB n=1 Tax=Vibrio fluvialis TaxID=676 RepID=UPI00192B0C49|nr:phosphate ABC transporter ATP-binding protein PstB [Vibrio fluvialis]MBL4238519.1 phosphate ABC transporter ATP-binding protein [Vibrio fluvialis]MBL4264159.1 phosphate ABC transporter ATP-binding protein [Vibrio fluvialis]MBL4269191.1 phosphate ABC transporter ATP-binding protein [Vibrio fluvialis]MBL4273501.1 phosphate ABC transporter ATP-binding protein [Vibrio fluvialis]MBO1439014.1 phosphate ABC transporter ATP-binding protein [Vibrio fluvialis]
MNNNIATTILSPATTDVEISVHTQATTASEVVLDIRDLNFYYDRKGELALKSVSLPIYQHQVTALIGPSGCGKSTLLRCLNRIYALYGHQHAEGMIDYEGANLLDYADLNELRSKIGMIFQKPTPFPMSIAENIAFGLRLQGHSKAEIDQKIEQALKAAHLWQEVKDKLNADAHSLSGGQQQRLCIARTIALEPDIILMDEPTSALDPIATSAIEELIGELKENFTIVIVTHNMQQAMRISNHTAFMYLGELVEFGPTRQMFHQPKQERTRRYISGDFG